MKICSFSGCTNKVRNAGLCSSHYEQKRTGVPLRQLRVRAKDGTWPKGSPCTFPGCANKTQARGYCHGHYFQLREGRVLTPLVYKAPGTWSEWRVNTHGYVYRVRKMSGKAEHQLQHRVVMEGILGRPLLPNENVHHKNGVRHDNNSGNLELWVKSQPSGQRAKDLVRWAEEIIALYGPDKERL